jgi:hypothetical protein
MQVRAKIVTTIGPNGWETYGRRFAESFKKFWPADIALEIWHHDLGDDVPSFEGITFHALETTKSFQKLKAHLGAQSQDGPSLQYCFKAVALASSVTPDLDWIGFIDADTETMRAVDTNLIEALFDNSVHLTYLYRKGIRESEGSWFAFNLATPKGASLLADYWGLYDSFEAFHYKKAHDNAVLDRLVLLHQAHGLQVKNLSEGSLGLDAFHQSLLGAYMIHYKGPDKQTIANPALGAPARYETLCELLTSSIKSTGKANIVEVGTWNGSRAIQMAEAAFATGIKAVSYVGFDTFEDGNDRTHEGHTKPHASSWIVGNRLNNYSRMMSRKGLTFDYTLIKGNTLETLPRSGEVVKEATFAYIDGGHSYETTRSDYDALAHVPFIVFDDVIAKEEEGAPEGPRRVFNEVQGQRRLITSGDGYAGLKQTISFGLVVREGFPMPELRTRIQVKPVDSVDKKEQLGHIAANAAALKTWIGSYQAHEKVALFVSAGPTTARYLDEIRERQAAGAIIFTVKHALPVLKKAGITPDWTVILDPRPVDGKSTHGIIRTDLFADVGPDDKFLFATMTHPSVREVLEAKGAQLFGWHAHTQATLNAKPASFETGMVVMGGTCSATRIPMLAFVMGFRRFEFYGYDFFYPEDAKQEDIKQSLMKVTLGVDKHFLTTGELVAAMQDLGQWNKWLVDNRISVKFHGEGAGGVIWKQTVNNYTAPTEYPF